MHNATPVLYGLRAAFISLTFLAVVPCSARAETTGRNPAEWRHESTISHDLPEELLWARDLRALGGSEVLVTDTFTGVLRWNYSSPDPPALLARRGHGEKEIWFAGPLAASNDRYAVSSIFLSFGWGRLDSETPSLEQLFAVESVFDLDLRGDQVLLLGVRRGEGGTFAPNGDIAWLDNLEQPPDRMKPVHYSKDGPGAASMGHCGMMEVSAARFMNDGSFVLVPGVEEGVFHFDASGQLLRTWTGSAFGFDAGCPLNEKESIRLAVDEPGRWRWVNGHRVVDEILPLPDGKPGLVIREVVDGKVRWTLKVPQARGEVDSFEIPISSPSEFAHLKGDVVDDRVYFLLWTRGLPPEGPDQPPRLVVMKITGKER